MKSTNQTAICNALKSGQMTKADLIKACNYGCYHNTEKHFGTVLSNMVKRGMIERVKPGVFRLPEQKDEYLCTQCGDDAFIGMSNWKGPAGMMIKKSERLCIKCAKSRGVQNPLQGGLF